jgi:DNA-binding MarR family transcriptional regulator
MAAASGLVDRLAGLGYVQRVASETDRRRVMVSITAKGTELVGRIRQDMIHNLGDVMATLSPVEQRMWLQIYEKIHSYCKNKDLPDS